MASVTFQIYKGEGGKGGAAGGEPKSWQPLSLENLASPEGYQASAGLRNAVNVALLLGQPLLLTGEPGTGKTLLAKSLSWELGLPLEVHEVKSTSTATELFYSYNALAQFHVAQIEARQNLGKSNAGNAAAADPLAIARRYLRYNALGAAIIKASPKEKVAKWLPEDFKHPNKPVRSIVLLDEIDKAPRDLPNDILSSLDAMAFNVPELNNARIEAPKDLRPILILTSNSEKGLPDAFLRRCIYYNIPFPSGTDLTKIVRSRIGSDRADDGLVAQSLEYFKRFRDLPALRKKPATAELLGWILTLAGLSQALGQGKNILAEGTAEDIIRTLPCLAKSDEDMTLLEKEVVNLVNKRGTKAG